MPSVPKGSNHPRCSITQPFWVVQRGPVPDLHLRGRPNGFCRVDEFMNAYPSPSGGRRSSPPAAMSHPLAPGRPRTCQANRWVAAPLCPEAPLAARPQVAQTSHAPLGPEGKRREGFGRDGVPLSNPPPTHIQRRSRYPGMSGVWRQILEPIVARVFRNLSFSRQRDRA